MERKFDVLVIGDINPDIMMIDYSKLPEPGQELHVRKTQFALGGGAAITGTGFAKMGLKTAIYSFLGNDTFGEIMLRELKKTGVNTDYITMRDDVGTGVSIALTTDKDRSFLTYQGTNQVLDVEKIGDDVLATANHIHLLNYSADKHDVYVKFLKRLRALGKTVSFDIGYDASEEWSESIRDIVELVDVFAPNDVEARKYTRTETIEDAMKVFADWGNTVVIKNGSKGSIAWQNRVFARAKPFRVHCVDTTGAGDSFNCGFVYGWLKGLPLEECLTYGNAVGAKCVEAYGGTPGVPTIDVIEEMVNNREK